MDARARRARVRAALEANAGALGPRGDRGAQRRRRAPPHCVSRRSPTRATIRRSSRASICRCASRRWRRVGRPVEAQQLVDAYDRFLTPGAKNSLTRTIAWGWVRTGDMARARAALAATGVEGDSSDAAGWLALYDGNLKVGARTAARRHGKLAGARARRSDSSRGSRWTARRRSATRSSRLAKGDSAGAAAQFVAAADSTPVVRSLLLATAAQIDLALGNEDAGDCALDSRSRPGQGLARSAAGRARVGAALAPQGRHAGATTHLEHLILTYPGRARSCRRRGASSS